MGTFESAKAGSRPSQIRELTDEQKFEVFVNKSMKQYRDQISLIGKDGHGKRLSEEETMNYVKLHCTSL